MTQLNIIQSRLKKPSVILSVVSQIISILMIFGFNVNESMVLMVVTATCSILVTLGILSNPDTKTKSYGDDLLVCSNSGKVEQHVKVNGQMVCAECGAIYNPNKSDNTTPASE